MKSFDQSFLKRDWFPHTATMPDDGMYRIVQQLLALQQSMSSMAQHLHLATWHTHPLPVNGLVPGCPGYRMKQACVLMLYRMCSSISGIVMDLFGETDPLYPAQHPVQLNQAVRLYAWSECLVHIVHEQVLNENELQDNAEYRLKELYGESLVHHEGEEAPSLDGTDDNGTDEKGMPELAHTFVQVYSGLREAWPHWRETAATLFPIAFPATGARFLKTVFPLPHEYAKIVELTLQGNGQKVVTQAVQRRDIQTLQGLFTQYLEVRRIAQERWEHLPDEERLSSHTSGFALIDYLRFRSICFFALAVHIAFCLVSLGVEDAWLHVHTLFESQKLTPSKK